MNGQRDKGQRGEEGGEKGRPKKKLWVQGLMMGPEAMADSVATPVKTTLKRRLQWVNSSFICEATMERPGWLKRL